MVRRQGLVCVSFLFEKRIASPCVREYTLRIHHLLIILLKSAFTYAFEVVLLQRRKPILTPCWNCFFDLLLVDFVIIIIQNGLPQRICPSAFLLKCLCLEPCLPVDGRKEEINTSPA